MGLAPGFDEHRQREFSDVRTDLTQAADFVHHFTPGNVHDSQEMDKLLVKTHGQVYADSAYANQENDQKLGRQNNKVPHRAYRNKPLTDQQKQQNRQRSGIRYIVERTFGLLKQHHGLGQARYLGLERNKSRAQLIAMTHNLKTGMNIFKQMRSSPACCV